MNGHQFEHFVCDLLKAQGYSARVTPGSGDHGADIIAQKDDTKLAVQVKLTSGSRISRHAVSDAVGAIRIYHCNGSMVVTNGSYSSGARELAQANGCVLVDERTLRKWCPS